MTEYKLDPLEYIKPYKDVFQDNYNRMQDNVNEGRYEKYNALFWICCSLQIGSSTNQYRVNLIKNFEKVLIEKFIKENDVDVESEAFNKVLEVIIEKFRHDVISDFMDIYSEEFSLRVNKIFSKIMSDLKI